MRYARELDEPRADLAAYGAVKVDPGCDRPVVGEIRRAFARCGLGMTPAHPVSVQMLPAEHASAVVRLDDGVLIQIDALGESRAHISP